MIEIKMFKQVNLSGSTFIEGFPGAGLVGPMTISYIIDKLKLEYVGYLKSADFPPLVSIHKNQPMPPIRIYCGSGSKGEKIVTIFAEFAIPLELVAELSDAVYKFIKDNGISSIYSIGGIPVDKVTGNVFVLASTSKLLSTAQSSGLKPVGEGVATGVSAMLLIDSTFDKLPDLNIMVPILPNTITPKYAEQAIASLGKFVKLNIDLGELEKEAQEVEAKIRDIISKHKEGHATLKKDVYSGPSLYA
jgi:predicted ATP-grasp superfamily ATP-dependent carboligase